MKMKFKPVYNFQSVEFEMEIENLENLKEGLKWYNAILEGLKEIAPEQPSNNAKLQPKEPMATDRQVSSLVKFGGMTENEARKLTSKQASQKIKELMEG